MADAKISALPAATTPLAGTEVLPIVQSSATDKVSVADLTAGRSVSALNYVVTGATVPANGMYLPSANQVGFAANSAQNLLLTTTAMTFTSSGAAQFTLLATGATNSGMRWVRNGADNGYVGNGSYVVSGGTAADFGVAAVTGNLVFSVGAFGAGTTRWTIDTNGFMKAVSGSLGRGAPVTKTGDFTLAATENWVISNRAATNTVTLPAASSWTGREVMFQTYQAQTLVSASSNVVPLGGGAAGTAILAATAGKWATLVSDGTSWIVMAGN